MQETEEKNGKEAAGEESLIALIIKLLVTVSVDWLIYCGLIKLITLCFDLTFTWKRATGIFLIVFILKNIFERKE